MKKDPKASSEFKTFGIQVTKGSNTLSIIIKDYDFEQNPLML